MIRRYDYRNKTATIRGFDGSEWTTTLGLIRLSNEAGDKLLFDMGTFLMYRKVNPIDSIDSIQAAQKLISSWPDFEEKDMFLDILQRRVVACVAEQNDVLEAALREVYGIPHALIIIRGIRHGKLVKHKPVLTRISVVKLVDFLLEKTPYLASMTFPAPKSELGAVRAAQNHRRYRAMMKQVQALVKGMDSFEIFTAFRVASYIEKVTMVRPGACRTGTRSLEVAMKKGGL